MSRTIITLLALALLTTSCGGTEDGAATNAVNTADALDTDDPQGNTTYPQPGAIAPGVQNPDVVPDAARHIARQERCLHWRQERERVGDTPQVAAELARECRGLDAELEALRVRYVNEGPTIRALRQFGPVEQAAKP